MKKKYEYSDLFNLYPNALSKITAIHITDFEKSCFLIPWHASHESARKEAEKNRYVSFLWIVKYKTTQP